MQEKRRAFCRIKLNSKRIGETIPTQWNDTKLLVIFGRTVSLRSVLDDLLVGPWIITYTFSVLADTCEPSLDMRPQ